MSAVDEVAPGDVICVRTKTTIFGLLIRLGAWLARKPSTVDHVVIAHHRDLAGIWWGIEGRPGGVGWVDLATYDSPWVVSNAGQPKTAEQRQQICDLAGSLLHTPYDWSAIAADAMNTLQVRDLWASSDYGDKPPGHVVCSSLAAWIYRHVGLAEPSKRVRWVEPCDWARYIADRGWLRSLKERS